MPSNSSIASHAQSDASGRHFGFLQGLMQAAFAALLLLGASLLRQPKHPLWFSLLAVMIETEDGRRLAVHSESPMSHGPIYVQLHHDKQPDEPYRSLHQIHISGFETNVERHARADDTWTAVLGLLAGLAWLTLPIVSAIGNELTVPLPRDEQTEWDSSW